MEKELTIEWNTIRKIDNRIYLVFIFFECLKFILKYCKKKL